VKEISKRDEFGFDFASVVTLIAPQIAAGRKSPSIDLFMTILVYELQNFENYR
jgi:hypothetical protein